MPPKAIPIRNYLEKKGKKPDPEDPYGYKEEYDLLEETYEVLSDAGRMHFIRYIYGDKPLENITTSSFVEEEVKNILIYFVMKTINENLEDEAIITAPIWCDEAARVVGNALNVIIRLHDYVMREGVPYGYGDDLQIVKPVIESLHAKGKSDAEILASLDASSEIIKKAFSQWMGSTRSKLRSNPAPGAGSIAIASKPASAAASKSAASASKPAAAASAIIPSPLTPDEQFLKGMIDGNFKEALSGMLRGGDLKQLTQKDFYAVNFLGKHVPRDSDMGAYKEIMREYLQKEPQHFEEASYRRYGTYNDDGESTMFIAETKQNTPFMKTLIDLLLEIPGSKFANEYNYEFLYESLKRLASRYKKSTKADKAFVAALQRAESLPERTTLIGGRRRRQTRRLKAKSK